MGSGSASFPRLGRRLFGEKEAGEELAIFVLIEPGALDVEEPQAGHTAREREGVDRELGNWLVGPRIWLVVENVDGPVANLQEIDVAGDRAARGIGRKSDAVLFLDGGDVAPGEPDRNLYRDRG